MEFRTRRNRTRRRTLVGAMLFAGALVTLALISLPHAASPASPVRARDSVASVAPRSSAALPVRVDVLRLSQCLSTLSPQGEWTLVLRAGIGTPQPFSLPAVARSLHISVASAAAIEQAALRQLRAAASGARCGTPPVLVHVPKRNRLARAAAVLTRPVPRNHARLRGTAVRARLSARRHRAVVLSFIVTAGRHGAAIRTISVGLPHGVSLSRSSRRANAGVVVSHSGRRLTGVTRIHHGQLTIRLKAPRSRLDVRFESPAITLSRALMRKVRTHRGRTLRPLVMITGIAAGPVG